MIEFEEKQPQEEQKIKKDLPDVPRLIADLNSMFLEKNQRNRRAKSEVRKTPIHKPTK